MSSVGFYEYEIVQMSDLVFKVFKYKFGFQEAEYDVANKNNSKWMCNCMSGHIRNYCKHKDWVKLVREGHADMLPHNVRLHESIDPDKAKRHMLAMLKTLAGKKMKVQNEKSVS